MKATPRGRRVGASALALFGFFALLASFLPGVANAQAGGSNAGGGNDECANFDLVQLAKFDWQKGSWAPDGSNIDGFSISGDDESGTWSSPAAVDRVIVKGGPGNYSTTTGLPATSGSYTQNGLPPVGQGNTPGISNIKFCGEVPDETPEAFVRVTSMCVDEAEGVYQIRVRHEGGVLPVSYNVQIGGTVLESGILSATGNDNANFYWLPVGSNGVSVVPADDSWENTYRGTASTSQNPCATEPETFEVSPAKVWVEPAPAGATATIALEVEDEGDWVPVADAVWTFDNEGGQTAGPESWTLDEGTVYRFVETEIGSPEGFECFEVEVDDAAADTLYNDCAGVEGEEEENGGENGNGGDNGDNGGENGGVLEDGEENGGEVGGIGEEAPTTTEGETAVAGATLPRTGVGSGLLAGLGIASLLAGLGLTRAGRRELV